MSILTVTDVSHGFGARTIFENISFRLLKGEHVALVGANGEGKSTFLNLITNKEHPDAGKIEWSNHVTIGYLDQHSSLIPKTTIRENLQKAFDNLYKIEQEMFEIYGKMSDSENMNQLMDDAAEIQGILDSSGFYSIDSRIDTIAQGLGLFEIGLDTYVDDLSGGQRTKILLTKLLLQNPSILILDEPTNYLDVNHIKWLTNYLQNYENAFILVSHDIPFINDVCNLIYHVKDNQITRYVGNYDEFIRIYEQKQVLLEKEYERQQKEVDKLEDFIARNKARVATRGMANSRAKKLEKMELLEKPHEKPKPTFNFKEASINPSRVVIEANNIVLGYDTPLTKPITFTIEKGQKIAICGVNGLGKSTLLKTLLGMIKPISGTVKLGDNILYGYFEQEDHKNHSNTAIEEIWTDFPYLTNHEVRSELAKCGLTKDNILSQMKVLSGGENAKVRLCKLLLKPLNLLILDEPTNHLDNDAKNELQKAIKEFNGTVILVSHEPYFYESFVTEIWNVENWTTKII